MNWPEVHIKYFQGLLVGHLRGHILCEVKKLRPSVSKVAHLRLAITCTLLISLAGCGKSPDVSPASNGNENSRPSTGITAAQVIERNRALDNSHDTTMKIRAQITGESADATAPQKLQLTIYHKHEKDGRFLSLIEFTAPLEERDRDGLITVTPDGKIEAVRYVQSTDSFIVTTDATSEDALFGMTAQELAEGQPEKYDFSLAGEETYEGRAVYRLEGTLKHGAESKFRRLVLLISKDDFVNLQAEFYDSHNELARRLTVSRTEQIAGHSTRMVWTINNRGRGKKIEFEAVDVKYDQSLNDSVFTRDHLKKIASR